MFWLLFTQPIILKFHNTWEFVLLSLPSTMTVLDPLIYFISQMSIIFFFTITFVMEYLCNKTEFFVFIWVFFHNHSRITGLQGKWEGTSLATHHHFHPFYRYLEIRRMFTAGSSPLRIGSSRTWIGNLWFLSRSR